MAEKRRKGRRRPNPSRRVAPNPRPEPADTPNEIERLRLQSEANLNALGSEFAIAQEWGLFSVDKSSSDPEPSPAEIILASLKDAQAAVKARDFSGANSKLLEGRA